MTSISMGPVCDSSFSPSCSWIAVDNEGFGAAGDVQDWPGSEVQSKLMSYFPAKLTLSKTIRPVSCESSAVSCVKDTFWPERCPGRGQDLWKTPHVRGRALILPSLGMGISTGPQFRGQLPWCSCSFPALATPSE